MQPSTSKQTILVLHGPNLNMLGKREPELYGRTTLTEVNTRLQTQAAELGVAVKCVQSNHEGELVDTIQKAMTRCRAVIINPGAYTHTSVAIRDALLLLDVPIIEVHLSNIYKREPFRHRSMIADVATGQIAGLGVNGYYLALQAIVKLLDN